MFNPYIIRVPVFIFLPYYIIRTGGRGAQRRRIARIKKRASSLELYKN